MKLVTIGRGAHNEYLLMNNDTEVFKAAMDFAASANCGIKIEDDTHLRLKGLIEMKAPIFPGKNVSFEGVPGPIRWMGNEAPEFACPISPCTSEYYQIHHLEIHLVEKHSFKNRETARTYLKTLGFTFKE